MTLKKQQHNFNFVINTSLLLLKAEKNKTITWTKTTLHFISKSDTKPKWVWFKLSQLSIILEGLSGVLHTARNKVLDFWKMLKQNGNHNTANLLQILQNRNDCIYFSASTYYVCVLRSFYCNKNIFLSQCTYILKKKIKKRMCNFLLIRKHYSILKIYVLWYRQQYFGLNIQNREKTRKAM